MSIPWKLAWCSSKFTSLGKCLKQSGKSQLYKKELSGTLSILSKGQSQLYVKGIILTKSTFYLSLLSSGTCTQSKNSAHMVHILLWLQLGDRSYDKIL